MEIHFYKSLNEKNKINKNLGSPLNVNGELIDNCDIVNPSILLNLTSNDLVNYNYCYIPAFERYYYINNIVVENKMLHISLHCDVLMSHKNDILNSTATIVRCNKGNRYIADNLILQTSKVKRQVKKIGTGFTVDEKYIVQIGG